MSLPIRRRCHPLADLIQIQMCTGYKYPLIKLSSRTLICPFGAQTTIHRSCRKRGPKGTRIRKLFVKTVRPKRRQYQKCIWINSFNSRASFHHRGRQGSKSKSESIPSRVFRSRTRCLDQEIVGLGHSAYPLAPTQMMVQAQPLRIQKSQTELSKQCKMKAALRRWLSNLNLWNRNCAPWNLLPCEVRSTPTIRRTRESRPYPN